VLEVSVIARSVDEIDRFLRNLEGTGSFRSVLSRDEQRNEQGEIRALIEAAYIPTAPSVSATSGDGMP
jgi:Tfp pilus assembly protein PilN